MKSMVADNRKASILFFALFSGWLLAVPFQGQVFYSRMTEFRDIMPDLFNYLILLGHFVGLVGAGFIARTIHIARKMILVSLFACLAATFTLVFPFPTLWHLAISAASVFAGLVIGGWGYYFQRFTPPGKKMQTAAAIIIAGNLIMILLNTIAVNLSSIAGVLLSLGILAASAFFCATHKFPEEFSPEEHSSVSDQPNYNYQEKNPPMKLLRPMALLYLFVGFITINSGTMYQVVVPAFAHHTLLSSIYWAVPYIGSLYLMLRIPERFNKSYLMYIAVTMIGIAYILYFVLDRSALSYILIDSLLLSAFGVCDLFWWTILGEMLTYTNNPARIFGMGLSANVMGILIGVAMGNASLSFEDHRVNSLTMTLSIVFVTLIFLPILYNKLAMVIKNQAFLVGLSRQWSEKEGAAYPGLDATPVASAISGAADGNRRTIEFLQRCGLTDREIEIALLLLSGETYKMIAQGLCISENTVKTHIKNIYSKLRVGSKTEFVKMVKGR